MHVEVWPKLTDFVKTPHCNSKEKKIPLITYAPSVYQDASELDNYFEKWTAFV